MVDRRLMRRGLRAALSLVATALAVAPAQALASGDSSIVAPAEPIVHAGRWLVDASGRVVIVHGVNMPSKSLPAYPAALGFGDADAAALASLGLNAVRLTVERYAAEPSPGVFDDDYLAQIAGTVRMLASHGILSLIDFHQDEYGPVFFDNGYPDWMTVTDGLPNVYEVGFPFQYVANPALERAFDHLWANDPGPDGKPLQSDDAAILSRVAAGLANQPGVLGYEILNEPWPGSVYPTCFVPEVGCPVFDRGPVSAYYRRMTSALRAADPARLIFYEPLVTFNYGIPTSVKPPADPGLGFAFHDYSACGDAGVPASEAASCAPEDAMVLANAVDYSRRTGTALLETEFGATFDTQQLAQQLAQYDQQMMPWMFWSYTRYIDPLAPDGTLEPPTASNLNRTMIRTLARPYPQLIAGTPIGWSYEPRTNVFTLRYSTRRAGGRGAFGAGSETDVAVPPVHYPEGYGVRARGARVISPAHAGILRLSQCPGAREITVTVTATPGTSATC